MKGWSRLGRGYFVGGLVGGAVAALVSLLDAPEHLSRITGLTWLALAVFLSATVAANLLPIKVRDLEFTVAGVMVVAAILLFPTPLPMLVAVSGTLLADVYQRKPWFKSAWNAASAAVTVLVATAVYDYVGAGTHFGDESWIQLPAILAMGIAYYGMNVMPLSLLLALTGRAPVIRVMRNNLQTLYFDISGTILFGVLVAFVWKDRPYLSVILAGLVMVVYRAFEAANRLSRETVESLETIVNLVDARDRYTFNHSLLVAEYSRLVAERLIRDDREIERIVRAAHLHDIGKIGINDMVLQKPDRLTDEEYEEIKRHPEIGAQILASYSQFRDGTEIVLAHQENYDGTGYPRQLKGDQIPLGARIVAVVDAFVAMTTDRPYRRAMGNAEAMAELRRGVGTQFDPVVCGTFIKVLQDRHLTEVDNVVAMEHLRERRLGGTSG